MPSSTRKIEIRLFGYPVISLRGQHKPVGLKHLLALAALLSEARLPVSRTTLIAMLWPDADEETARSRLRRLIYKLSQVLGDESLCVHSETIALRFNIVETDSRRFRHLAEAGLTKNDMAMLGAAVAIPEAAFLDCFDLGTSPEFEDWASAMRIELGRLLLRSLRVLAEHHLSAGGWEQARTLAERMVRLDPLDENSHGLLLRADGASGNMSAIEKSYRACSDILWRELRVQPSAETQALYRTLAKGGSAASTTQPPPILFTQTASGSVAYAAFGAGPPVIVLTGYLCHLEVAWEDPRLRGFLTGLARTNRVIMFDRRGIGLSERMGVAPTIEAGIDDVEAILDAEKIERAILFGASDGRAVAIRFAASRPARTAGLVLFAAMVCGSWRSDYPWALKDDTFRAWSQYVLSTWGTPTAIERFAPSVAEDPGARAWWARMLRTIATPRTGLEMLNALSRIDVREDLPSIRAPTRVLHRTGDRIVRFGAGRHLAAALPNARLIELEGADHLWWVGDYSLVLGALAEVAPSARSITPAL